MPHQFPNITGQAGVYKTGNPAYIAVPTSAAEVSGRIKFGARATAEGWADGDVVGVKVYTSEKSLIALCSWDGTNKRLNVTAVEETSGVFVDDEDVIVESVLSRQALISALASVANDFVPIGGVFVVVPGFTGSVSSDVFSITESHNGKTICVTGERWLAATIDLPTNFQCSILQETSSEVRVTPVSGVTLNGGTTHVILSGENTGAYLYARTQNDVRLVL